MGDIQVLDLPWLDENFIIKILENEPEFCGRSFKVLEFSAKPATKGGDNYSSFLYRISVKIGFAKTVENAEENCKEFANCCDKSYVVKLMHPADTDLGKMFKNLDVFEKELGMYTEILKSVDSTLNSIGIQLEISPRCLYATRDPYELMVLEDLQSQGFKMPDRTMGLDKDHCDLVMTKLGRLHAASMYMNKKDPKYRQRYVVRSFHEEMSETMKVYMENGILQALDVMRELPQLRRFVGYYEDFSKRIISTGIEDAKKVEEDDQRFNVMNHGDFWMNNMMFRYGADTKPIDVKFVDFQMTAFSNPGYDINYFFATSVEEYTRDQFRDQILQSYHSSLVEVLNKLEHKGLIPTIENLHERLLELKDIGLMSPCIVLPLVKLNKEDSSAMTTEELMDGDHKNSTRSALYSNPVFHDALTSALNHLEDIGFIQGVPPKRRGAHV